MTTWTTVSPYELNDSAFRLVGKDWMLITVGSKGDCNTMTASWGALGELWNRPVSFCFIRPPRYTFDFMERYASYTLSFFGGKHRKALNICGSRSGRDYDKITQAGLTAVYDNDYVWFAEAHLVLKCHKIYWQDITPDHLLDPSIDLSLYPQKDYHRMFVGTVDEALRAD